MEMQLFSENYLFISKASACRKSLQMINQTATCHQGIFWPVEELIIFLPGTASTVAECQKGNIFPIFLGPLVRSDSPYLVFNAISLASIFPWVFFSETNSDKIDKQVLCSNSRDNLIQELLFSYLECSLVAQLCLLHSYLINMLWLLNCAKGPIIKYYYDVPLSL